MKRFLSFICISILLMPSLLGRSLTLRDIQPISMQMLSFHVENNQLSPHLVKRIFKVYIDQFDPLHTYLLKSEVDVYYEMTDRKANEILQRLKNRDYTDFESLTAIFQKSIPRAREIRGKVLKSYEQKGFHVPVAKIKPFARFPKNITELTDSIHLQTQLWILFEKKNPLYEHYNDEERLKAFAIWERRQHKHENTYLYVDALETPVSLEEENHLFSQSYLKAFAKSLDGHTMFFTREEVTLMRMSLHKQFRGIGIVIRESGKGPYIADIVKGGPADRSKRVHQGDLLVAVDGDRIEQLAFEAVLKKLEGKEFSKVVLTLKKPSAEYEFDVVLRREQITMDDQRLQYRAEPYGDGIIGVISFDSFYDNGHGISAEKDLKKAILELRKQGKLKGIVLDIRNNPGGFLSQAVKISGVFIPDGIIAIAKYSTGEVQYSRDLDGRMYYDGPLVVLTSKASASASEVIAQALQDYHAAVIVGDEHTYGKGTMQFQNITDPRAPHYFKVTVGRYYTVSGRTPQLDGVISDIVVKSEYAPYNIGERYLPYPISRDHLGFSFTDPKNPIREVSGVDEQHLYSSFFPKQRLKWKAMIPTLKDNSAKRLAKDADYQQFLSKIEMLNRQETENNETIHGLNDLQLKEAIHIVKDMIVIDEMNQKSLK